MTADAPGAAAAADEDDSLLRYLNGVSHQVMALLDLDGQFLAQQAHSNNNNNNNNKHNLNCNHRPGKDCAGDLKAASHPRGTKLSPGGHKRPSEARLGKPKRQAPARPRPARNKTRRKSSAKRESQAEFQEHDEAEASRLNQYRRNELAACRQDERHLSTCNGTQAAAQRDQHQAHLYSMLEHQPSQTPHMIVAAEPIQLDGTINSSGVLTLTSLGEDPLGSGHHSLDGHSVVGHSHSADLSPLGPHLHGPAGSSASNNNNYYSATGTSSSSSILYDDLVIVGQLHPHQSTPFGSHHDPDPGPHHYQSQALNPADQHQHHQQLLMMQPIGYHDCYHEPPPGQQQQQQQQRAQDRPPSQGTNGQPYQPHEQHLGGADASTSQWLGPLMGGNDSTTNASQPGEQHNQQNEGPMMGYQAQVYQQQSYYNHNEHSFQLAPGGPFAQCGHSLQPTHQPSLCPHHHHHHQPHLHHQSTMQQQQQQQHVQQGADFSGLNGHHQGDANNQDSTGAASPNSQLNAKGQDGNSNTSPSGQQQQGQPNGDSTSSPAYHHELGPQHGHSMVDLNQHHLNHQHHLGQHVHNQHDHHDQQHLSTHQHHLHQHHNPHHHHHHHHHHHLQHSQSSHSLMPSAGLVNGIEPSSVILHDINLASASWASPEDLYSI